VYRIFEGILFLNPQGQLKIKHLVPLSLEWSELILCTEVFWVDELVMEGVEKRRMFGREEKCMQIFIEKPEGKGGGGAIGTGRSVTLSGT
jgi:hypothetical protein